MTAASDSGRHAVSARGERLPARSLRAVWHPCTQMKHHEAIPLLPVARGEGCWLYDFEGRRFLDAISSWWVNLFGHCNPRIGAAIAEQLGRIEHVLLAGCTHEPAVALAERLARTTMGRLGHCFYASDGACAVEIALKMSFHYWRNAGRPRKRRFVSLEGSYHGETLGALAVTDVALFRDTYAPLLMAGSRVASPDWRGAQPGESAADYAVRRALDLAAHLEAHGEETAALIVEPLVQGATGMAMYDAEYLRRARALCDRHEVHLIADEIMTGFGRTGTFYAHEQAGITPDFLTLSKGLTGGYLPLSVVMTRDAIHEAFHDDAVTRAFLHSHSYTGNPLACRAALATLDIFDEDAVIAGNRARSARLTAAAAPLATHARVRNFRNTGMIWAFEVAGAGESYAREFAARALARELLLRPLGGTVYFMPPYAIGEEETDLLARRTVELLDEVP
ncbi:MAG: adenosylmethionine--8-amino-7-oxononanoate transaminase [Burkholderiales bacterium]|nr:adenosylmethionine--8-amino-7-oxononanoate transaminase [Burkholderiales bacterium]